MRLLIYRQSSTNTKWRFTKQKKSTLIHYQRHRKISYLGYKTQRVIIRILTLISKIKSYDDSGKHFRVKTQTLTTMPNHKSLLDEAPLNTLLLARTVRLKSWSPNLIKKIRTKAVL